MKLKMFSIRDAKSEIFTNPFYKATHGEAERDFRTTVNNDKTTLNRYPEDFDLYYLGTYDDNTGFTASLDTPQHIIKAVQVLEQKPTPIEQPLSSAEC